MKDRYKILASPLFLLGLGLLLVNDFYLKQHFGNWWTGKLSDISGLIIFPLFLTALFPKQKMASFVGTIILFTIWKLPLSNALIAYANSINIPLGRTIDYTDLFAFVVLPFAYYYETSHYRVFKVKPQLLILLSTFAFVATTFPPKKEAKYVNINRMYQFDFSRSVLISRLNRISAKKINKLPKYFEFRFDSEGDLFYSKWSGDTLAVLLDSKKIQSTDTIHYETVLADFVISGNDSVSSLKFINAYKIVPRFSDKEYREKAIREFERKVIKRLKK